MPKRIETPSRLSEADRLAMVSKQHQLDLARERQKTQELSAQLYEQTARADHFESQSKLMLEQQRHKLLREAAGKIVDATLQEQKELAASLAERYGIDWKNATWSPETGEIVRTDPPRSD